MATNPYDKYVTNNENPYAKYVSKDSVDENPYTKYTQNIPAIAPQDITVNEDVLNQKKIAQGQVPVSLETEGGNLLGALNASLPWNRGTPESNATIDKYVGGFAKRYQDTMKELGGAGIDQNTRSWLGDISQNENINPYVRKALNPLTSIPANIADYLVAPVLKGGIAGLNAISGEAASLATIDPMLGVSHEVPNIASKPVSMPDQFRATYENIVKNGTFEDAVNFAEQNGMHFAGDDLAKLRSWFAARDAGKKVNYRPTYEHAMSPEAASYGEQLAQFEKEHGVAADNAAGYESNITAHANLVRAQAAEELVNEGKRVVENLTKDWTNAPDINVIHDWSQVEGNVDRSAVGAYMPDGSVAINMTNAAREAELAHQNGFAHVTTDDVVQAAVYHESLGHYGLAQKFGADLDNVLSDMYNQSGKRRGFESFKEQVDKWIADNPKAYKNDPNPLARAVEEVLAEKSEKGQLTPTMLQQLLLPIKKYARKLGLKLAYTPEEVEAILASSHRGVTHGVKAEVVAGTDPRYMYIGQKADLPNDARRELLLTKYKEDINADLSSSRKEGTGWFKGPDGKFRFEISDKDASLTSLYGQDLRGKTLKDLLSHDDLYTLYPELKDIKLANVSGWDQMAGTKGWFNPETNTLGLSAFLKNPKETLLHEIQHYIQEKEGWAKGGSPEVALSNLTEEHLKDVVKNVQDYLIKVQAHAKKKVKLLKDFTDSPAFQRWVKEHTKDRFSRETLNAKEDLAKDLGYESWNIMPNQEVGQLVQLRDQYLKGGFDEIKSKVQKEVIPYVEKAGELQQALKEGDRAKIEKALSKVENLPFQAYESLFGEVEARDTGLRQNLSLAERRSIDPYSLEGKVKPDEYVYKYMRTYSGRLNQEKISGIKDLDHWMTEAEDRILAENPNYKDPVTQEETIRKASELGLTTSKLLNESEMRSFQGQQLAAKMFARAQLLTNKLAEVEKAADIVTVKGGSVARANFAKKMAELAAIQAKVSGDTAEIGRALNILKVTRVPAKKSEMVLKYMKETTGNDMWTNPEAMDAVARMMREFKGTDQTARIARDMTKKSAGDYITSGWYNAMLSGYKTLAINGINTPLNVALDMFRERGIPTLYKKVLGLGNASIKDYTSRVKGFGMAMRVFGEDANGLKMFDPEGTYMRTIEAWRTGTVKGRGVDIKPTVYTGPSKTRKVLSTIGTYPVRALAATDEYWRNILQLSSYYGEAAKIAEKENLVGDKFAKRVLDLVDKPTKEMMEVTQNYTDVMMLKDKPSVLGETLMKIQHPKDDAGGWANVASKPARILFPFSRTSDRVTAMGLRNLGPLGLLSRQTKNEILAGGFKREQALTRVAVSTLFLGSIAPFAIQGRLTGANDRDHPYSFLIGDQWHSYRGIEPVATPLSIIADIVNTEKKAQDRGATLQEKAGDYVWAMGNSLKESSQLKDLYDVMSVFDSDPDQAKRAYNNLVVNKLSSVVPAIVRNKAQAEDPYMRDTSSDGTVQGRLEDRIKSALPGYSKELPIRHDKWGREVRRDAKDFVEKDPTVLAVEALQKQVKQPIIGDLQKTVNINGFKTRLNSEEFQKYQRLAGYWTLQYVKQDMETKEYKKASKEEKIQIIQKARNEARKDARDYLFKGND